MIPKFEKIKNLIPFDIIFEQARKNISFHKSFLFFPSFFSFPFNVCLYTPLELSESSINLHYTQHEKWGEFVVISILSIEVYSDDKGFECCVH